MSNALANFGELYLYIPKAAINAKDMLKFYALKNLFQVRYFNYSLHGLFYLIIRLICGNYDLIYGRNWRLLVIVSMFKRVSIEFHQPLSSLSWPWVLIIQGMCKLRRIKQLVVISKPLQRDFAQYAGVGHLVRVLHDGADSTTNLVNSSDTVNTIGYVGQVAPGRGIELIIHLAQFYPGISFDIYGGPEEYVEKYQSTKIPNNVNFKGFIEPALVPRTLQSYDILLAPYASRVTILGDGNTVDYMSPLKIFEYMASGVPIICSDHPVLREICDENEILFVDPENINDWVRAIEMLYSKDIRMVMASKALQKLKSEFTWRNRAEKLISFEINNG